jgi:predicted PurR-regulated permease PerM
LRGAVEQALASGLPGAPEWLFELPVVGPTLGELWNSSAADISGLINAFKPYLGMVVENGFSLLLGIAHGVLLFVLALFIAFFFYVYGDPIAIRLRALLERIAGIVISGADSIIRPWFISRGAELPFVLTVLGVLGGAISFGLLGIFLGPVLLGVGYTLVKEWTEPVAPELRDIAPDKRD